LGENSSTIKDNVILHYILFFKADVIKHNFEKCYYVPIENEKDDQYNLKPSFVKKRGIYKDVYKGSVEKNDYQLRPNACIAIALAPELFVKKNAFIYIGWVEKDLMVREY
jgi:glycogen debranching enzyme